MKTQYQSSFIKDLKVIKSTPFYATIRAIVFEEIPNLSSLAEIRNLKKLKGYENTYRIRIGDYRIGFIFDGETIIFARVLHRREVYRYFP
ncbi:MAG: hypothetical protein N4J56_001951 [Chroococcidiopsis sp. SAG 2025]|uniref:type II toxin-antitoxin system RelE family toxin n=1 Tax=Chroococcidiopsis sp. SAG 2025 TaxID=171389 RepID=UPI00293718F2|nr:type II toxin-antitoxin system RelE/ParE family toxin [Chroococcidiopsis sp. SAG 2025]MDV2992297.1 hypothetical protein [Chroococcidiopsis sp. SAG 2025]